MFLKVLNYFTVQQIQKLLDILVPHTILKLCKLLFVFHTNKAEASYYHGIHSLLLAFIGKETESLTCLKLQPKLQVFQLKGNLP